MSAVSRLLRIACATACSATGRIAYRLGFHGAARRQFERVLLLRGADFAAYLYLSRIAFDLGDYSTWRREFEHARRTDPLRFARLRAPHEGQEPRLAGTRFDGGPEGGHAGADARATWASARPFGAPPRPDRALDLPLAPDFDPLLPGPQVYDREPAAEAAAHGAGGLPGKEPSIPDASLCGDDFSSAAERRRFQLRRPIDRREIARCDLDDLARRLSG